MSTLSATIRTAWSDNVWESATVTAITDKVYLYDVGADSQFDAALLYYNAEINFFTCRVQRQTDLQVAGNTRYTFEVRVEYYLQQTDVSGSTYNTVQDRLEAVDDLVLSALGKTWDGTVDFYRGGAPIRIESIQIDGRECWKGGYVYTAFKTT